MILLENISSIDALIRFKQHELQGHQWQRSDRQINSIKETEKTGSKTDEKTWLTKLIALSSMPPNN